MKQVMFAAIAGLDLTAALLPCHHGTFYAHPILNPTLVGFALFMALLAITQKEKGPRDGE